MINECFEEYYSAVWISINFQQHVRNKAMVSIQNLKHFCLPIIIILPWIFWGTASNAGTPGADIRFDRVLNLESPAQPTMLQDSDGFLWFGTEGGGIIRYDGYEIKKYEVGQGGLSNGIVFRIIADRKEKDVFWIATSGGGLNRFDEAKGTFTYYMHDPNNPNSLGDNTVEDIVQDGMDPDIFWLGTLGSGLNRFDRKTGRFKQYRHDPKRAETVGFPEIWKIIEDGSDPNVLWLGTYGGGLDRFEKDTESFTPILSTIRTTPKASAQKTE